MCDDKDQWYKTEEGFGVYEVNAVQELLSFMESLQNRRRFMYRGQCDPKWPLETKTERNVPDTYKRLVGIEKLELDMLAQFQRRAHLHLRSQDVPKTEDRVEWLAMIQHHGGPTRLLDFTKSVCIATYFAVNDPTQCEAAAVWAVNWQGILWNLQCKLTELGIATREEADELLNRALLDLSATAGLIDDSLSRKNRFDAVVPVAPFRQNRRQLHQNGVFVAPLNINNSFMDNLRESCWPQPDFGDEVVKPISELSAPDQHAVIKFIIKHHRHEEIRRQLRGIGLRTETLFPDLEGEARALSDIKTEHALAGNV